MVCLMRKYIIYTEVSYDDDDDDSALKVNFIIIYCSILYDESDEDLLL